MDIKDKRFIDSTLNVLAYRVYSQLDINLNNKEKGEALVQEFETYIFEAARDIFEAYRNAGTFGRMMLAIESERDLKNLRMDCEEEYKNDPEAKEIDEIVKSLL